jgi:hypothetical protein
VTKQKKKITAGPFHTPSALLIIRGKIAMHMLVMPLAIVQKLAPLSVVISPRYNHTIGPDEISKKNTAIKQQ